MRRSSKATFDATPNPLAAPSSAVRLWTVCLLLAVLWPLSLRAQRDGAQPGHEIPLGGRLIGPDGAPAAGVEMRLMADGDAYQRVLRRFEGDDELPGPGRLEVRLE